jgi:hypothetical protein
MSRFPAAFRLPTFASRSSDSRRGVPPSSRSAYRPNSRTPTGLPRSARTSRDRVGCSLYPEDNGAHPGWSASPTGVCRILNGQSLHPAPTTHHARLCITRHQREFKRFTSPVFPSPVAPGWNGSTLGFPRASHPADQEPDDARRGGDRPPSTDLEQRSHHIRRTSNLVVHSYRATSRRTALCRAGAREVRMAAVLRKKVSAPGVGWSHRTSGIEFAQGRSRRALFRIVTGIQQRAVGLHELSEFVPCGS